MQTLIEKAKAIRLLILDVDGVLTNGTIYYGNQGMELKGFHIHDGLGIKLLQQSGVVVAVISAKKSEAVSRRLEEIQVKHAYLGHNDKLPAYEDIKQKLSLTDHQIAYMGDDLPDLPVLNRVALPITVPEAPDIIQHAAEFITTKRAGKGAVREVCEFLLKAQNNYQAVIQSYLTQSTTT